MTVLHKLFKEDWEYRMRSRPVWASYLGDKRYNDRWSDESFPAIEARNQHRVNMLAKLSAIDRGPLAKQDRLSYDLFKEELESDIEGHAIRWHLIPIDMRSGIQTTDTLVESLPFEGKKDYEDWIARMQTFGVLMDQTIEKMREGIRAGMVQPRIVADRIPNQIHKQLHSDPTESGFYKPFLKSDDAALCRAAAAAIQGVVVPAYQRLDAFFETDYLPATYPSVGVWQFPNGEEAYRYFVKSYTSTNYTPDEVHQIGLDEVARIRAEMEKVMRRTDFTGTLDGFFNHVRDNKALYFTSADELLTYTRALCKQIDPLLSKYFRTLPRIPYGVVPIPDSIAPDTTAAYYSPPAADGSRAGNYYINLYMPETRMRHEMPALTMHEAVPGHHLQIALATELTDLPDFRRHGHWTSYVEGWALYSESLGEEMGLYDDPYTKFGQLTFEMWRAIRLVVDTGMHWLRWDRQKAIDYFLQNSGRPDHDVINEVDRYIGWPGQALAYKIGEIKVWQLRRKAEKALGDRFSLRDFHDVVLLNGAVPLSVLENLVDDWISS